MRRDLEIKAGPLEELPIDLHLFREAEIVRHLDDDDTVENGLVGMVGLEPLPLRLVAVRDDDCVDVDCAMPAGCRDHLLLCRRDHGVEILGLVLEDLDELHHASIADVEGAVQLQHPRITLGKAVELADVLRADQDRGVLVVGIDRRDDTDALTGPDREGHRADRHLLVLTGELVHQAVPGDRINVSLDPHAQHLLERAPKVARDEAERIAIVGRAFDHIDRVEILEATLQAVDQRALS